MNATRLTARPALRWLLALLAGGLIAASWSSPAHAVDNTLVASTPAGESTVETSPTVLTLQFANQLGTNNTVTMSCGPQGEDASPVTLGSPVLLADQVTLSVSVPNAVNKGVCNVVWQVTDTSLQPAGSGSFSFAVANDPVVTTPPTTTTTVP
ncbi:MAG TPA: copper resistance protein CopC, partial [Ilumatobacteraceae bacterium]|nr:copper resistance protein CopC [Ilumatobacteraceae bacterium]